MTLEFDYIAALHQDMRRVAEGVGDLRADIAELRADLRHHAAQTVAHERHDQARFEETDHRLKKLETVFLKAVGASMAVVGAFEVWRTLL